MQNKKYLQRIKLVYDALKVSACDIVFLEELYRSNQIHVLKRQIYRDLESVKNELIQKNETFIESFINNKKKVWKIVANDSKPTINSDEFFTYSVIKNTVPLLLDEKNTISLIQTINQLFDGHQFYPKSFNNNSDDESFINTHFYHKKFNKRIYNLFKDLYWCIVNNQKIVITRTKIDTTCNSIFNTPIHFVPLNFLLHRGSLYIGGICKNKLLVYDLIEIVEYESSHSVNKNLLLNYKKIFSTELNKRFGISENMDESIYDIELLFPEETGFFISNFFWHHSQQFTKTKDGYLLKLNCGINRELVGWIFMWMSNVKIIQPLKLKEVYHKQIEEMMKQNKADFIQYSNPFLP